MPAARSSAPMALAQARLLSSFGLCRDTKSEKPASSSRLVRSTASRIESWWIETNRSAPAAARVRWLRNTKSPFSPIMRTFSPDFSRFCLTSLASFRLNSNSGIPLAEITPGSPLKCPTSTATSAAASSLEAREVRLALLQERAEGLLRLGRVQPLAEDFRLLFDRGRERRAVARLHQALGQADGLGRQRGERGGDLQGVVHQLFLRHDFGDDAGFMGLLRGERL